MRVHRSPPGELKRFSMGLVVEEDNGMPDAAAEPEINDLRRLLSLTQRNSIIQKAHITAFTIAIAELGKHLLRLKNLLTCQEKMLTRKRLTNAVLSNVFFLFFHKTTIYWLLAKKSNAMSPMTFSTLSFL